MKQKLTSAKLLMMAVLLGTGTVFSQNQSGGAISTTISPAAPAPVGATEAFRFKAGIVTQLENQGTSLFGFSAADQWHSIGRINGAAQTVTGLRAQRAGRGLLFGFDGALQSGTTPTLGEPIIQWGGNSGISVTPGNLLFRSFASPTSTTTDLRFVIGSDGTSYGTGNLLGQVNTGIIGVANPFTQWMSMGKYDFGTTNTRYGTRIFRRGSFLTVGFEGDLQTSTQATFGFPIVEWGSTVSGRNDDLIFRNFSSATFATPTTRFKMTSSGNSYAENGFLGHFENGTFGDITGTAGQWISFGRVNGAAQTLYGSRIQRAGRALVTGFDGPLQTGNIPTLGDAFIQWIGNNTSSVTPGNLDFRVAVNPTNAKPTQVFRLKADGRAYFGLTEVGGYQVNVNGDSSGTGIYSRVFNNNTSSKIGINSEVSSFGGAGADYISVIGNTIINNSDGNCFGLIGTAVGGNISVGVQAESISAQPVSYGVWGISPVAANSFAGFFLGNVFTTGSYQPSDKKLKNSIQSETNVMTKVMQLNPVHYYYNISATKELNMPDKFQHGFVAQEMEKLFPEMVVEVTTPVFGERRKSGGMRKIERMENFKSINYTMLIPLLTKAIQEQQQTIQELKNDIITLKNSNQLSKDNNTGYTLSQNVPNPFSSNTTISYTIPKNTATAVLMVTDLNGKMLLQFKLSSGSSQQIINGNNLPAGIYVYSLIVNGAEMISKRMVLTKP